MSDNLLRIAEVALPLPIDKTFHYAVPERLIGTLAAGMRVLVPFGRNVRSGYIVGFAEKSEFRFLKDIIKPLDAEPVVTQSLLKLTRWMADYYLCSWGEALQAVLPSAVRRNKTQRKVVTVAPAIPHEALQAESLRLRTENAKWSGILEFFNDSSDPVPLAELMSKMQVSSSPIKTLVKKGLLKYGSMEQCSEANWCAPVAKEQFFKPNPAQTEAINWITGKLDARESGAMLLWGITGSGKTEVYMHAIARALEHDRQAIVLVPEIALTPQAIARFNARFDDIAVLHSHLSDGERAGHWRNIRSGKAKVIVGARSAVFAPVPRLGVIIVDEEHETTFKQENTPRYHARDVAVMRARMEGAVAVLGSATPSLESYQKAVSGEYHLMRLPARIGDRPLPPVTVIDMAAEMAGKREPPVLSRALELKIRKAMENGEQTILFLNRRGFTTYISCQKCDYVMRCPHCEVTMTYHKKYDRAMCHYCDTVSKIPDVCPKCGNSYLRKLGIGTEKVEEFMRGMLGSSAVTRMDSDTMKVRGAYKKVFDNLWTGDIDVLIGTQMVAKGFDFPNVTVVGIIAGDISLYIKDFRSAERTFQLITQVAGRAGRGPKGGEVVVQSFNPDHYSVQAAARHDYEEFATKELAFRKELGYPPFSTLLRIIIQGPDMDCVPAVADMVKAALDALPWAKGKVLGPSPAPIAKIRDRHRWHLMFKAKDHAEAKAAYRAVEEAVRARKGCDIAYDIDPVVMM